MYRIVAHTRFETTENSRTVTSKNARGHLVRDLNFSESSEELKKISAFIERPE